MIFQNNIFSFFLLCYCFLVSALICREYEQINSSFSIKICTATHVGLIVGLLISICLE